MNLCLWLFVVRESAEMRGKDDIATRLFLAERRRFVRYAQTKICECQWRNPNDLSINQALLR